EVGEMSPVLQVKLLRVLQDREIRPVGADRAMKVDVRVVAASNKDLAQEVEHGRFREDLFYRLQVIPIVMPALRERRSDIPLLIRHFLEKHNRKRAGRPARLSEEALRRTKGNKQAAARLLGLKRTTLVAKLRRRRDPDEAGDEVQEDAGE